MKYKRCLNIRGSILNGFERTVGYHYDGQTVIKLLSRVAFVISSSSPMPYSSEQLLCRRAHVDEDQPKHTPPFPVYCSAEPVVFHRTSWPPRHRLYPSLANQNTPHPSQCTALPSPLYSIAHLGHQGTGYTRVWLSLIRMFYTLQPYPWYHSARKIYLSSFWYLIFMCRR